MIEVRVGRDKRKSCYQGRRGNPNIILSHILMSGRYCRIELLDSAVSIHDSGTRHINGHEFSQCFV